MGTVNSVDGLADVTTFDEGEQALALGNEVVLLRAVEVARLLGVSQSKVYQMMSDGELPVLRIGRAIRVPKQALVEWIKANTRQVA